MPGRVCLAVVAGPIQGRQFAFEDHDTFLFGRSPDCHAQLAEADGTASRHHFLLEVNPPNARAAGPGQPERHLRQRDASTADAGP